LGDVIHALPVLPYLESVDPHMEIDWIVEEPFATLLESHPLIRRVHRIHTKLWRKPGELGTQWRAITGLLRSLRKERYQKVLDLQGNSKSGLLTFLCGAPLRYGFDARAVKEWPNLLATNRRVALGRFDHHITDRSLRIAESAFPGGVRPNPAGPIFSLPDGAEPVSYSLSRQDLPRPKTIVFHPGASWPTKMWALEHWQELARQVVKKLGADILLTWGNAFELEACRAIQRAAGGRATIWPRCNLPELAALLNRVAAMVGGDTGPLHLAAALGTPTVSLFRVTDCSRNGPRGIRHRCLQAPLQCSPCLKKNCSLDDPCSQSIDPAAVYQALREVLGDRPHIEVTENRLG
jgi:heptosyltransferase-1